MTRLIHFSGRPLTALPPPVDQTHGEGSHRGQGVFMKPMGLWVSPDDDEYGWKWWCEGERFRLTQLTHMTEIVLRDDARILRINDSVELNAFHDEYSSSWEEVIGEKPKGDFGRGSMWIKWAEVSKKYDGIMIVPYLWELRFGEKAMWYYSWDCACGCIWNMAAVAELRPYRSNIFQVAWRTLRYIAMTERDLFSRDGWRGRWKMLKRQWAATAQDDDDE